jgi:hypothetical protein
LITQAIQSLWQITLLNLATTDKVIEPEYCH